MYLTIADFGTHITIMPKYWRKVGSDHGTSSFGINLETRIIDLNLNRSLFVTPMAALGPENPTEYLQGACHIFETQRWQLYKYL